MTRNTFLLQTFLVLSCSLGVIASPAMAREPAAVRVEADTPGTTPAGATFTLPAGWSSRSTGNRVVVTPPEPDAHFVIVDVKAKDADAAVAAGWAAYRAGFKRPLRLATPQAALNGWEERRYYEYETSPNERLTVDAMAWRAGEAWAVVILESGHATMEKRAGPLNLLLRSLRPKGYQRESFAGKTPHPLDAARIGVMQAFVADGMKRLHVPGVGFSLIDGGKIVYEGGLGVRELGKPERIDKDTLFIAASNTKALTTLLLAELVDEDKLAWDKPVTQVYPTFKLGDADTTRQVQVKHLICACTGLPRQDMEWLFEFSQATPASSLALLGTMQPTSKFGEVFQYSNLMAAAAGYIGAAIAIPDKELGAAYDEAMRKRVFEPLGMTRTTFDFAQAMGGNHASPHGNSLDGKASLGHMALNYSVVPVRPAGGVWTSAHDLSQYVMMELAGGKLANGKRLVSEENLLARRASQVITGEDTSYGMGLTVDKRWDIPIVRHGGSLAGYKSDMIWLPEHGVGAVILTNSNPGYALLGPFLRRLLEVLFDGKPEAEAQLRVAAEQIEAERVKANERLVVPPDRKEAGKLAAHYTSDALGDITIHRKDNQIVFDIGEWRSAVGSRKNDDGTTSFITVDPTLDGFPFVVGEQKGKRTLIMRDAQHEYIFVESP